MALSCCRKLGLLSAQPLGGVLAKELVQLEAAELGSAHKRLAHEPVELSQTGSGHRGRRIPREGSAKDRELREHAPFVIQEESPRLVECGAEAAVPLRDVVHRRLQEAEVALDLVCDI